MHGTHLSDIAALDAVDRSDALDALARWSGVTPTITGGTVRGSAAHGFSGI
jgi:hypothetical protein